MHPLQATQRSYLSKMGLLSDRIGHQRLLLGGTTAIIGEFSNLSLLMEFVCRVTIQPALQICVFGRLVPGSMWNLYGGPEARIHNMGGSRMWHSILREVTSLL